MFCVFGKTLQKEYSKKRTGEKPESKAYIVRYGCDTGAYQISPEYSSKQRCLEFIELAKNTQSVRCLYIAELKPKINGKGDLVKDKKTGAQKMVYQITSTINPAQPS